MDSRLLVGLLIGAGVGAALAGIGFVVVFRLLWKREGPKF